MKQSTLYAKYSTIEIMMPIFEARKVSRKIINALFIQLDELPKKQICYILHDNLESDNNKLKVICNKQLRTDIKKLFNLLD